MTTAAPQNVMAGSPQQPIRQTASNEGVVTLQRVDPVGHVRVAAQHISAGRGTAHHHPGAQLCIPPHRAIAEPEALDPQGGIQEITLHQQLIR